MCDDAVHRHVAVADRTLSRRRVLQGMVALAALAGCTPGRGATGGAATPFTTALGSRSPSADRLEARIIAMHLHASTSEGEGSVASQLAQAATHGYDVAWFTEHDWRRRRLLFRPTYSFVPGEKMNGGAWELEQARTEGTLTAGSTGRQVEDPVSPADPAPRKASLRIQAASAGADPAALGFKIQTKDSRLNLQSRIAGRVEKLDVLPVTTGPDAWGEVLLSLSHHPATGRRPAGVYAVRYRLRTDVARRRTSSQGLTGIVDVPVTAGRWQEIVLDPVTDLAEIYPDMDSRDHSLHQIVFRGVSRGGADVDVCFGHLRLEEQDGYDALGVENDLVARYAPDVPGVLGVIGTEISLGPHVNQYGGEQTPYDYGPLQRLGDKPGPEAYPSIVDHIHAAGGLACINHPGVPVSTLLAQNTAADLVEVGFGAGGTDTVERQLAFWDTLSRNGLFLTGNGASDDHSGQGWEKKGNRYYTAAWAGRLAQPELLDALGRGRAYVGYLGSFAGTVDMALDDETPMGAVVVGAPRERTLRIDVTGLPDGGAVQLVRGAVDRAGVADPTPGTAVVQTFGAGELDRAGAVPLDVSGDCFHRLQVIDGAGAVIAYGQPIWLLGEEPPGGVPDRRRAS